MSIAKVVEGRSLPHPVDTNLIGSAELPDSMKLAKPAVSPASVSLRVLQSLEQIEEHEECWRRLTPAEASPFQTFSWNLAWYRHCHQEYDQIFVIVLYRGETVVAILPCYRKGRSVRLAGDTLCDYQDVIAGNRIDALECMNRAYYWLEQDRPRARFFFQKLSSEGWLYSILRERNSLANSLSFQKCFAPCPYVRLDGGLAGYLERLPSKVRQEFRRNLRRWEKTVPDAECKIHRAEEISPASIEEAAEFHETHFRADGLDPLSVPSVRAVLTEVSEDPDVGLQLATLSNSSETFAVDFGFARGGKYFGFLGAFHAGHAKLAPSKCLLLLRIDEWMKKDRIEILDFLAGSEAYKRRFTLGESYSVYSVHLLPDTWAHRARKVTLVADRQVRHLAKKIIAKSPALSRAVRS